MRRNNFKADLLLFLGTPRTLPTGGIRIRSGIRWARTRKSFRKKCNTSAPVFHKGDWEGRGLSPEAGSFPAVKREGALLAGLCQSQGHKGCWERLPQGEASSPKVWSLAPATAGPATLCKAAEPEAWLRGGQQSPSKAREAAGKHFCSAESKSWTWV